ncbi:MAG: LytB protein [Gammaproteobacteria bacterium]|nr:LytB protein [Gammaproteobacteria bacterium]
MIINHRYLEASLFSFCIHASIFLYLYGTFNSDFSKTLLISKPLQIELKFDLPSKSLNNQIPSASIIDSIDAISQPKESIYSKLKDIKAKSPEDFLIDSNISNLLSEENEVKFNNEQLEIEIYASKIISSIENAWMKPRNIPEDLIVNLKLQIRPSGRISKVELIKSSGNIRFDNSALNAVRRVETFNFFDSLSKSLYEKEFRTIAISFNPS